MGSAASAPPVLDQPALFFSTYLGGSDDEADWLYGDVVGIAVDAAGNTYVTGTTHSADFPVTGNQTLNGNQDVFVTKLSPAGDVVYSTHVGGPCDDIGRDIAVDAAGNAYVTGRANAGFCPQGVEPGVLVAKLGPTGSLVYSFVFGGTFADSSIGEGIAVDAAGNAYVTGPANSDSRDFPTTPGAFRTVSCDDVWHGADGFVAKVDPSGTALVYATYLCGTGDDDPRDIAIDAAGNAYVAGSTSSADFPTANALEPTYHSASDGRTGFVAKLSPDGARLVYSTYFGGSAWDAIGGLALDAQTNVYVTGSTTSVDFPTTPGVLQAEPGYRLCVPSGPCSDAFVAKLDPSGAAIVYSTYLFGELDDAGSAIAVDGAGNAYVVGTTHSRYFPLRDAFQTTGGDTFDAFIAELNADGTRLVYGSYLGGNVSTSLLQGWDEGYAVAVDAAGDAFVAGTTQSNDFPTTPGAFQPALGGGGCDAIGLACRDAFVTRITRSGAAVTPLISLTAAPIDVAVDGTITATWAGIPAPGADDELALFPLGSWAGHYDAVATWSTGARAAASQVLSLPAELPPGTYELRLLTPDPDYFFQPTVVARTEPIRVSTMPPTSTTTTRPSTTTVPPTTTTHTTTSTTSSSTTSKPTTTIRPSSTSSSIPPTTTSTTPPSTTPCEGDATACDDGDTCTDDTCVPGQGCASTPASGFASVVCTCRRSTPDACADDQLPPSIARRQAKVCTLFDAAAETQSVRRLKRSATALVGAMDVVSKARRKGKISTGCADALTSRLHDERSRVADLLATFDLATQ